MSDLRGPFKKAPSPAAHSIVGSFLRTKREATGLSQRALGQLFVPAVTTQFISNIERGVTPLPPVHIETLVRVLNLSESDLITALEKEYAAKISHRAGRPENADKVDPDGRAYFQTLYEAYQKLDPPAKDAFLSACESLLHVRKPDLSKPN